MLATLTTLKIILKAAGQCHSGNVNLEASKSLIENLGFLSKKEKSVLQPSKASFPWFYFELHTHENVPLIPDKNRTELLLCVLIAALTLSARVQNVRYFSQARELESEINARFLLNEHNRPHFLMHGFKLHKVFRQ